VCGGSECNFAAGREHRVTWGGGGGGVPTSPRGMKLNYLFFADDSLLFCKATAQDWSELSKLLDMYEKASGQRLNKDKTAVFF
jgi:hypothetical protein